MGGTTPSQALRFPWVDDVISESAQGNLGADVASKLTAQDSARALVIQRPYVVVRRLASQSIANNTDTTVIFDNATYDPYTVLNIAGQPTRITPGASLTGLWKYSIQPPSGNTWVKLQMSVLVSGTVKGYRTWYSNGSSGTNFQFAGMVYIPTGTDFIEFKVKQNSGGAVNMFFTAIAWRHSA